MKYLEGEDLSFTPCTHEQEQELFRKYRVEGDLAARDTLILSHLKLVRAEVLKYWKWPDGQDEAMSEATNRLVSALDSFDYTRPVRFSTYLGVCVRGELLQIRKRSACRFELVLLPREFEIDPEETGLNKHNEFEFSAEILELCAQEAEIENRDILLRELIHELLRKLPKDCREFLLLRSEGMSFREIGEQFGVTEVCAQSTINRALRILRPALAEHVN